MFSLYTDRQFAFSVPAVIVVWFGLKANGVAESYQLWNDGVAGGDNLATSF